MSWQLGSYFSMSRADRLGCLWLMGFFLLLIGMGLGWLWRPLEETTTLSDEDIRRYQEFLNTIQVDSIQRKTWDSTHYAVPERVVETFYFDPNTADSTTLLRLGLRPWQVRNIYKYRAAGGRYHRPDDFSKLYGLTLEDFQRLRPYIRIDKKFRYLSDLRSTDTLLYSDTTRYTLKITESVRLELNTADTTDLQRVPGLGPVLSRRIVNYRERLGGFVRVVQLSEIEGLPQGLEKFFVLRSKPGRTLNLNNMSFDALQRHPYLNFYQSKVIVEHRRKFGPIQSLDDLSLYEEFTTDDLERLTPYVSY